MKEIEKFSVEPLSDEEATVTNGGFAWIAIAGAVIYAYNNIDDFAEGFEKGFKEHYND